MRALFVLFVMVGFNLQAQVKGSVDSTEVKIGEQITYTIEVATEKEELVIFPEGQTFSPLEVIESYPIDTVRKSSRYNLVKKYGLTQFDSGSYTIPAQKVLVADKIYNTDSLRVEINAIEVDTTKQGLFDIKPIIDVEKPQSNWWKYLLVAIVVIGLIGLVLWWFIWREKPLSEEEKIALLPPYDRAKLALKQLDESQLLERSELKEYYSGLTFAIRRYLDEKVYDHALESTTDELIFRLNLLREGNKISLSRETIDNLRTILKRADLVKFAKSAPDVELAKMDRSTVDLEIDHVKESLPEASEEEKLLDEKYRLEKEQAETRRKYALSGVTIVAILLLTYVGFGLRYGFAYVTDTIIGNESKELLEGEWVNSAYGIPPIYVSTPEVLERVDLQKVDQDQDVVVTSFSYGGVTDPISILAKTTRLQQPDSSKVDLRRVVDETLTFLEKNGVTNMLTKQEKFVTPNAQEGIKVYGSASFPSQNSEDYELGNYAVLAFSNQVVVQQLILTWREDDTYAQQIMDRVLNSVELQKPE